MHPFPRPATVLLTTLFLALPTLAQKPTPAQTVAITVVDAHTDPAQPVPSVRVSLSYVDGQSRITDARDVTNHNGQTFLEVSPQATQRGDLRLEITGPANLVIFQPADGQLAALPATISLRLLPRGSTALLGPPQIEAMLHRTLLQVSSLQKQNRTLTQQVAQAKQAAAQPQDINAALADWAKANGFPPADAEARVQQWGHDIQQRRDQATCQQQALAQLALKNNDAASQQFTACFHTQLAALDNDEQEFLNARRHKLSAVLSTAEQAAGADQLAAHYHLATDTLDQAATIATAEYKKHPDDRGFHDIWLQASSSATYAREREGEVAPAADSLPLLARVATECQSLAAEYTAAGNPQMSAVAQTCRAISLEQEGSRTTPDKAPALYAQAIAAYQQVLTVYTKPTLPRPWAYVQVVLGNTLLEQAEATTGPKAAALYDQATQSYNNALEIYTRSAAPEDWAYVQVNLGNELLDRGDNATGAAAQAFYDQAAQAYRNALEVFTRDASPQNWATAQMALGNALDDQSTLAPTNAKALDLLQQSVQAVHHSLEIRTKADLPQDWAAAQADLGFALNLQGQRTADAAAATALFQQASQAYQHALEVYTKTDLPQQWARMQNSLAELYIWEGERTPGKDAFDIFEAAAVSALNALEVDTQAALPERFGFAQTNLGNALTDAAAQSTGAPAKKLIELAIVAYNDALTVRPKADVPKEWSETQSNLGYALFIEAKQAAADPATAQQAPALFTQSLAAYQNALEIYTRDALPRFWAATTRRIALVHQAQGNAAAATEERAAAQQVDPQ
jgi:hypothetical protein